MGVSGLRQSAERADLESGGPPPPFLSSAAASSSSGAHILQGNNCGGLGAPRRLPRGDAPCTTLLDETSEQSRGQHGPPGVLPPRQYGLRDCADAPLSIGMHSH
eukprot:4962695-Alexandrium_andersonii.AAC.1